MTFRLKTLTVENFRSVRGKVSVSLDAPIVLIHGPNGAGKTSLLSAIELGLTGAVTALSRGETGFLQHLPHKDSPDGTGRAELIVARADADATADLKLTMKGIEGVEILSQTEAAVFSERCYLAQSALGRLLEVYQHQDARRSNSPLTRFVKELLGIDPLDALIDGLHDAGDVRRLRAPAPHFWAARVELPALENDANASEVQARTLASELQAQESEIRGLAGEVLPADRPIEPDLLASELSARLNADEGEMVDLTRRRREIEVIRQQVLAYANTDAGAARQGFEQALTNARVRFAAWAADAGQRLENVIQAVQSVFADVPPVGNGAEAAQVAARTLVTTEIVRLRQLIAADAADERALAEVRASIAQGRARIELIDRETAELAGTNQELANALAALVPHIHDDKCPVCDRDYGEISEQSLEARVSARIAELVETAGRLEALARDKAAGGGTLATANRRAEEIRVRRLTTERLDALKVELARLEEWLNELTALGEAAREGTGAQAAVAEAERRLADLSSQDATLSSHLGQLADLAHGLAAGVPNMGETAEAVAVRLMGDIDRRFEALSASQGRFRRIHELLRQVGIDRRALEVARSAAAARRARVEQLAVAKAQADQRIDLARALAERARGARTAIVRKVFNDNLNAIWRELFIRLAPEEDFVPVFKLPELNGGPVEAVLETIYRKGGRGGDPRTMLSAGNLNTAALTLFLALHLSVAPTLPLLMIDDPVQSMDEVHVAQFAALLRTLKGTGRQVVIAVHERALFDYLTLELSPAFNGDRLITVELSRAPGGETMATWDPKTFKADEAIAA